MPRDVFSAGVRRLALRLWVNRLASALLCFIFYLSLAALFPPEASRRAVLLSGLLGCPYALGSTLRLARRQGERDRNLVRYGHKEACPLSGLWAGLWAEAPALLLFLALVITYGTESYWLPTILNMGYNNHYWWLLALHPSPWMMALSLPLLPAAAAMGYGAGFHDRRPLSFFRRLFNSPPS